ncbi:HORMA domain-containing protein [Phyllosticta citribraziliensis]
MPAKTRHRSKQAAAAAKPALQNANESTASSSEQRPETSAASNVSQPIKLDQSTQLVQSLFHAGISCVAFLRRTYENRHDHWDYDEWASGKKGLQSSKQQRPGAAVSILKRGEDKGVDHLLDWLEKGVFHALKKRYLETFQFIIIENEGRPSEVLETYDFRVRYTESLGAELVQISMPGLKPTSIWNARVGFTQMIKKLCMKTVSMGEMDTGYHSLALSVNHLEHEDPSMEAKIPSNLNYTDVASIIDNADGEFFELEETTTEAKKEAKKAWIPDRFDGNNLESNRPKTQNMLVDRWSLRRIPAKSTKQIDPAFKMIFRSKWALGTKARRGCGRSDRRVPKDRICYRCLTVKEDPKMFPALRSLALMRCGIRYIERFGFIDDSKFAAGLEIDRQTASRLSGHLREKGYLVPVTGQKKHSRAHHIVKSGPAYQRMIDECFAPFKWIEHLVNRDIPEQQKLRLIVSKYVPQEKANEIEAPISAAPSRSEAPKTLTQAGPSSQPTLATSSLRKGKQRATATATEQGFSSASNQQSSLTRAKAPVASLQTPSRKRRSQESWLEEVGRRVTPKRACKSSVSAGFIKATYLTSPASVVASVNPDDDEMEL